MTKDSRYIDNEEVTRVIIDKQEYSGDEKQIEACIEATKVSTDLAGKYLGTCPS